MDVLSRGEPLGNAPGSGARAGAEAASIGPASLPAFGSRSVLRLPGLRPLRLSGREADGHQMLLRVLISIPRGHAVPLEALHLPLEPCLRLVEAPELQTAGFPGRLGRISWPRRARFYGQRPIS